MSAPELQKRFYKEAGIFDDASGFGVALDSRAVKTPCGADFRVPTRPLAKACALEWGAQGDRIVPAAMPLTQLAFAAIDTTPYQRDTLADHITKYGETDLVSHRADTPAALAKRQGAAWDGIVEWAASVLELRMPVVIGIIAADVPALTLIGLRARAKALDDFHLTALAQATDLAGSALIGLALLHGQLDGAHAYASATIDEHWSLETWGDDAEARERLAKLKLEFEALGRFIAALG